MTEPTNDPIKKHDREAILEIAKRTAVSAAVIAGLGAVVLASAWHSVFHYVAPGKILILKTKTGDELPPGQLLAKPGQKGIQEEVLGEGRYFILPVVNEVEEADAVEIGAREVGVVTAYVGTELPNGKILADPGEKGVQRQVLPPGRYRLNPHGYKVEKQPWTVIRPGYVGFVTALVGKPMPAGNVLAADGERGPRKDVLAPGIYYLNPRELRIEEVEVGINQVSFLEAHQLTFPSADAFPIKLEATVEWELHPAAVPQVMKEFGARSAIEEKIIGPESHSKGRLEGSRYAAKDFLLGEGRESFQTAFTDQLVKVAKEKNVQIHSAFIRHIVIPPQLLKPIQEAFISVQKKETAKFWEATRRSAAELEGQKAQITQREQLVAADTTAILNSVKAQAELDVGKIEAETRRIVAEKQQAIAEIEAQRTLALGQAEATVQKLLGDANAQLFALKVAAFGDDATAFRRYAFAEALPPTLSIRLVQQGQGTFWTDLVGTAGLDEAAKAKLLQHSTAAPAPAKK